MAYPVRSGPFDPPANPALRPVRCDHALALDCLKVADDARQQQRAREVEDLRFQVPELQWPSDVKRFRIGDSKTPQRPMLSIPKLDQPIQLVANQERSAHLGITVHALNEDADDDTAKKIQGLYRRIEVDSRANLARSWAFDRGIKAGTGAYRILTEYDPGGGHPSDQRIVIKRILYQDSVLFDPTAEEPDFSDGRYAFIKRWLPFDRFKTKYGKKSKLSSYEGVDFANLLETAPDWVSGDGAGRAVLVAEYFWLPDDWDDNPEAVCQWALITGADDDVIEQKAWNGRHIPLVFFPGRELQPFDGDRRWVGITRPAMDAQRLYNYQVSALVETLALAPKAPWVGAEGQFEGHPEWESANERNWSKLEYRPVSFGGHLEPPPHRDVAEPAIQAIVVGIQQAERDVQATTFTYDPSLGHNQRSGESGRKVLAEQQQGDASNSHYLDNLAQISLTREATIVLDMIPRVYDRPGRIARLLGTDDKPETVMLNQPFVVDPQTKRPMPAPPGAPNVKEVDLRKGIYGVEPTIGKAYPSRLQEGADKIGQAIQAAPGLLQLIGDIYFKFQDFPGHTEIAERLEKMLPPQIKGDQQGAQDPQKLQQQMQQVMQQHDLLTKELDAKTKAIESDQAKHQATVDVEKVRSQSAVTIQAMKDATSIAVAKINALTKGVTLDKEAEDERIALGLELSHEHAQNELDRQHEAGLSAQQAAVGADQMAQEHQQGLEAGDVAHQQNLEAGQAGHEQALEQQAAAPTPEAGP